MKKKIYFLCGIIFVIIFFCVFFSKEKDKSVNIMFNDEEMKNTLINTVIQDEIIEKSVEFDEESLEKIKSINIGYTGYYSTLLDIKRCKNVQRIYIGIPEFIMVPYYKKWYEKPKPEENQRILQIEDELADILQNCSELRELYINNDEGTCELKNLEFLEHGEKLISLWLWGQKEVDYTYIYNCINLQILDVSASDIDQLDGISNLKKLEILDIKDTNIAEAGEIIYLENLKELRIYGTPLAENEKELDIIREALPNLEIDFRSY
ncbi:MAG: hypothetical protein U0L79_08495 [Lachnospiraceae bacterium]|nr:hypothetical protein [Lachnospiraceae bacterium]